MGPISATFAALGIAWLCSIYLQGFARDDRDLDEFEEKLREEERKYGIYYDRQKQRSFVQRKRKRKKNTQQTNTPGKIYVQLHYHNHQTRNNENDIDCEFVKHEN